VAGAPAGYVRLFLDEGPAMGELLRTAAARGDLPGPEIAQHLFVSVNTLRTHTKHIFTKLDVKTRRAAVLRASGVGLL
jgi:LuxR family maltose regulon positive regulatory protein